MTTKKLKDKKKKKLMKFYVCNMQTFDHIYLFIFRKSFT